MGSTSRSHTLCRIIDEEIMDVLTAVESEDEFFGSESNADSTVVHSESGGDETIPIKCM
jgi:hypothetical protein